MLYANLMHPSTALGRLCMPHKSKLAPSQPGSLGRKALGVRMQVGVLSFDTEPGKGEEDPRKKRGVEGGGEPKDTWMFPLVADRRNVIMKMSGK